MLSVRDTRRSRSKSPSGRERSRSRDDRSRDRPRDHSRDTRSTKHSSKKYYESESESDRGHGRSRGGKSRRSNSSDDDRGYRSKKKYYESESESESDRGYHKHEKSRKSDKYGKRRDESAESESDRHHRHHRSDGKSKKKHRDESSSSSSASESDSEGRRKKHDKRDKHDKYAVAPTPPGYVQPAAFVYAQPVQPQYPPVQPPYPPADYRSTRHMSYAGNQPAYPPNYTGHTEEPGHHRTHSISSPPGSHGGQYMSTEQYRYATGKEFKHRHKEDSQYIERDGKVYVKTTGPHNETQYVEVKTGKSDKRETHEKHEKHRYGSASQPNLVSGMNNLAVAGAGAGGLLVANHLSSGTGGHGKPPASPLLEAYRGTYQSMSPMPSPLMIPGGYNNEDVSDIDSLDGSDDEGDRRKIKIKKETTLALRKRHDSEVSITEITPNTPKRVSFYDPEKDAKALEKAINHTHIETGPLIKILPHLTSDEILLLRTEYKKHAKVGGVGINISKQIKMKVPGNLGKAAYATALGRWESEAYWANCWYQGGATRRELLIESLIGRSNSDIREIKRCFSDKRYNDDLEKCMKAELKADKFRTAILLALEERRQPEGSGLDVELVRNDVRDLYSCLVSREGGETAMINIIVVRSDSHLREVMKVFEASFKRNFAREMINKSQNLVGETLAHILNGALNRPMRDALLLHQAIAETAPGKDRVELLISRVVRLHWEPKHMERVKLEYMKRYQQDPRSALEREVKGEVGTFLGAMLTS